MQSHSDAYCSVGRGISGYETVGRGWISRAVTVGGLKSMLTTSSPMQSAAGSLQALLFGVSPGTDSEVSSFCSSLILTSASPQACSCAASPLPFLLFFCFLPAERCQSGRRGASPQGVETLNPAHTVTSQAAAHRQLLTSKACLQSSKGLDNGLCRIPVEDFVG